MNGLFLRMNLAPTALVTALLAGCAGDDAVGSTRAPVVYDTDDRYDVYDVPATSVHRAIAEQAIGAIIPEEGLIDNLDGTYSPYPFTLADMLDSVPAFSGYPMCPGELFGDQPAVGSCSGTLIADDLFMTAGHCAELCGTAVIAFDYYYAAEGVLESIDDEDLYFCDRVVVEALTASGLDYAIFQLDRPVEGREPVAVDVDYSVENGDPLVVMGFPSGIPLKIEGGGEVVDARASERPDFFMATTDTFQGNSGSGVFDADGVAIGILVRGQDDYALYDLNDDQLADCVGTNVISTQNGVAEAESITYVSRAIEALCAEEPARCDGGTDGGRPDSGGGCSASVGAGSSPLAGLAVALAAVLLRRRRAR